MIGKVVIENGQKKIQALTADTGVGAPVGSYLYLEKKSNPQGYLYCDGSTFDETAYPALYQYLGTNVLPDWREFSAVGAEQNTTSAVIATHDVFTQGQEKDDQIQNHSHYYPIQNTTGYSRATFIGNSNDTTLAEGNLGSEGSGLGGVVKARNGAVTRGKSRAVFIYIKATSGLTENQQENVLNTINENNSYSTEEHPTGAKWIDGKPIYRISFRNISVTGDSVKYTVAQPSNVGTVVDMKAICKITANGDCVMNGYGSTHFELYYDNLNTQSFIVYGTYDGTVHGYVEYTKTTD